MAGVAQTIFLVALVSISHAHPALGRELPLAPVHQRALPAQSLQPTYRRLLQDDAEQTDMMPSSAWRSTSETASDGLAGGDESSFETSEQHVEPRGTGSPGDDKGDTSRDSSSGGDHRGGSGSDGDSDGPAGSGDTGADTSSSGGSNGASGSPTGSRSSSNNSGKSPADDSAVAAQSSLAESSSESGTSRATGSNFGSLPDVNATEGKTSQRGTAAGKTPSGPSGKAVSTDSLAFKSENTTADQIDSSIQGDTMVDQSSSATRKSGSGSGDGGESTQAEIDSGGSTTTAEAGGKQHTSAPSSAIDLHSSKSASAAPLTTSFGNGATDTVVDQSSRAKPKPKDTTVEAEDAVADQSRVTTSAASGSRPNTSTGALPDDILNTKPTGANITPSTSSGESKPEIHNAATPPLASNKGTADDAAETRPSSVTSKPASGVPTAAHPGNSEQIQLDTSSMETAEPGGVVADQSSAATPQAARERAGSGQRVSSARAGRTSGAEDSDSARSSDSGEGLEDDSADPAFEPPAAGQENLFKTRKGSSTPPAGVSDGKAPAEPSAGCAGDDPKCKQHPPGQANASEEQAELGGVHTQHPPRGAPQPPPQQAQELDSGENEEKKDAGRVHEVAARLGLPPPSLVRDADTDAAREADGGTGDVSGREEEAGLDTAITAAPAGPGGHGRSAQLWALLTGYLSGSKGPHSLGVAAMGVLGCLVAVAAVLVFKKFTASSPVVSGPDAIGTTTRYQRVIEPAASQSETGEANWEEGFGWGDIGSDGVSSSEAAHSSAADMISLSANPPKQRASRHQADSGWDDDW